MHNANSIAFSFFQKNIALMRFLSYLTYLRLCQYRLKDYLYGWEKPCQIPIETPAAFAQFSHKGQQIVLPESEQANSFARIRTSK